MSELTFPPSERSTATALPREDAEQDSLLALLQHYIQVVLRRKLVVAVVLALSVGAGWLWLQQQVPIYRATTQVIIDSDPPKVFYNVRDVVELGSPKDYRGQITYFETQYRIIKSVPVAEMVLNQLDLWGSEHLLGLDAEGNELTPADKQAAFEAAHLPSLLASRIQVRPIPNSMLVQIDFEDSDKAFATEVVNAVAKAYEQQNLLYKENIVREAMKDLETTVASRKAELEAAENGLLAFETDNNVGSIEAKQKAINDRLDQVNVDLTKTRSDRIRAEALAATVSKYTSASDLFSVQAPTIMENEVIRALKTRIVTARAELAALQARYLDKHPEVIAKEKELASLTQIAGREIRNLAVSAQKQLAEFRRVEAGLTEELKAAQAEQQEISSLALSYGRLVDDANKLRETYGLVGKRLAETKMSSQFEANNVRILEPAIEPNAPISPRRTLVLATAFVLGLLLAFGAALVLEYADATVKNWRDLEERTGYKVLGVIPIIGHHGKKGAAVSVSEQRERDLYIVRNPGSTVAEASRTLRTNLLFMSSTRDVRSLLITSASPSEGKSMMAVHTATSMASSGGRVLLVEADMRRPRLASSLGVNGDVGLSTCLVSTDSVKNHIQKTEVDNLDVIVCGPMPPNPSELLHTPRFRQVLEEMKAHYDTVIFDSPPLLPVTDALILAQVLDAALVVVRAGQTSRHALRHALHQLEAVDGNILGTVLNYQAHKRFGYGGYGYGYGYGYGHGQYTQQSEGGASAS